MSLKLLNQVMCVILIDCQTFLLNLVLLVQLFFNVLQGQLYYHAF